MAVGDFGYQDLTPETQQYLMGQYNLMNPQQQAGAASAYGSGGLGGLANYWGTSFSPTYGQLNPAAQNNLMGAYNALPSDQQTKAATAFSTGGLGAALPYLNYTAPSQAPAPAPAPAYSAPVPDYTGKPMPGNNTYESLSSADQQAYTTKYNALPPDQQQKAVAAYGAGGLSAVAPYMNFSGQPVDKGFAPDVWGTNSYGGLSPAVQQFLTAQYGTLSPAQQAQAVQGYNTGGIAGAMPYLGLLDQSGGLNPTAQNFLYGQISNLSGNLQRRAYSAYMGNGLEGAMPYLGLYAPQYQAALPTNEYKGYWGNKAVTPPGTAPDANWQALQGAQQAELKRVAGTRQPMSPIQAVGVRGLT